MRAGINYAAVSRAVIEICDRYALRLFAKRRAVNQRAAPIDGKAVFRAVIGMRTARKRDARYGRGKYSKRKLASVAGLNVRPAVIWRQLNRNLILARIDGLAIGKRRAVYADIAQRVICRARLVFLGYRAPALVIDIELFDYGLLCRAVIRYRQSVRVHSRGYALSGYVEQRLNHGRELIVRRDTAVINGNFYRVRARRYRAVRALKSRYKRYRIARHKVAYARRRLIVGAIVHVRKPVPLD